MASSPAPVKLPPIVASWRNQIERLSKHASPGQYLAPAKWAAIRANALSFLDQHGAEAHRLGCAAVVWSNAATGIDQRILSAI